jgi:hypothetical protein
MLAGEGPRGGDGGRGDLSAPAASAILTAAPVGAAVYESAQKTKALQDALYRFGGDLHGALTNLKGLSFYFSNRLYSSSWRCTWHGIIDLGCVQ